MKKLIPILITLSLGGSVCLAHAEDLLQVYQQAKSSNPDLNKAAADRDATYAGVGVSRSVLLPQLNLGGSLSVSKGTRDQKDQNTKNASAQLTLSQTLFDFGSWQKLSISKKQASVSEIAYQAAEQQLLLDTSIGYFNVLRGIDNLSVIQAKKEAIYKQLEQTKERYKVGLLPITDMQNTQAQYDQTLADEVTAQNGLDNSLEILRQISGKYYNQLNGLNIDKFKTSSPGKIKDLLTIANSNNLNLLAAKLAQQISRDTIKAQQSGYMPNVSLEASAGVGRNDNYGYGHYNNTPYSTAGRSYAGQNKIALNVTVPLFSGGNTYYSVQQAKYQFVSASESLEKVNRTVVQTLRSSYNNIMAANSTIMAYKQAVVSAQSSLDATMAGYKVGTRTIVDVLNATTTLYNAKQQLSNARFDYLINSLQMKSITGKLSEDDLVQLNKELGKAITVPSEYSNM